MRIELRWLPADYRYAVLPVGGFALTDENGEILPGQTEVLVRTVPGDISKVVVTFNLAEDGSVASVIRSTEYALPPERR